MLATIELKSLDITPNDCALAGPLELQMEFANDEPIAGAVWEIKYMVDMAGQRQIVELGVSERTSYAAGAHTFRHSIASMDFTGVKTSLLRNVGLLLACLKGEDGEEILQVSMVTQVAKGADGELTRTVLSPLE